MNKTRSDFTHSSLLSKIRATFNSATQGLNCFKGISLTDCLMSGLAIFSLKYKSLLQFEKDKSTEGFIKHNLASLYGVRYVPCDTYLRERLDGQNLSIIRFAFARIFAILQRSRVLEHWKFLELEEKFLISLDGSGFFSSNNVKCNYCCEKVLHRGTNKETTTYYHQMLIGSIVSPSMKQVLPIGFEPIIKEDGAQKNDCERNCAKRWLELFRKSHPRLPTIIVGDGLYSNGPFIKSLQERRCSYILVAKEDDHQYLYDYFWTGSGEDIGEFEVVLKNKLEDKRHQRIYIWYRFMNNVPLNDANYELKVNVLYFEKYDAKKNKTTKWLWGLWGLWVTDIEINKKNAKFIMKGGRARWKIENETFNTLKNQGYNFEHNFGHGYNGLSNLFAGLMLLAFCIDQVLEAANLEVAAILKKYGSRYNCYEKIRSKFCDFMISSFERLYEVMIIGPPKDRWL